MKLFTYSTFIVAAYSLCATQLPVQQTLDSRENLTYKRSLLITYYTRVYNSHYTPRGICKLILYTLYGDYSQYKNKPLPDDLSNMDLRFFDFTGCTFQSNLTNSRLEGAILNDTTYQYDDVLKKHTHQKDTFFSFFKEELYHELKNTALFYPKLTSNQSKANLLLIGSGLSRIFLHEQTDHHSENIEFFLLLQYWSSCLLILIKQDSLSQVKCSYQSTFQRIISNCWLTQYNKQANTYQKGSNTLQEYYRQFTQGALKYCFSNTDSNDAVEYYITAIQNNLLGLQKSIIKSKINAFRKQFIALHNL